MVRASDSSFARAMAALVVTDSGAHEDVAGCERWIETTRDAETDHRPELVGAERSERVTQPLSVAATAQRDDAVTLRRARFLVQSGDDEKLAAIHECYIPKAMRRVLLAPRLR